MCMCSSIDRRAGTAVVSCAGHPPPILVGRIAAVVPVTPGVPMGLSLSGNWTNTVVTIERQLIFYTDGLLENPLDGPPKRRNLETLLASLRPGVPLGIDGVVATLMHDVSHDRTLRDDVTVLVVETTAVPILAPSARNGRDHRRKKVVPSAAPEVANPQPDALSYARARTYSHREAGIPIYS